MPISTSTMSRVSSLRGELNDMKLGAARIQDPVLQEIGERQVNLEVKHYGLEAIAPEIGSQAQYVLSQLKDSVDSLSADMELIYDHFDAFVDSGPHKDFGESWKSRARASIYQKLTTDYIQHASNLMHGTMRIGGSKESIRGSIKMIQLQTQVGNKHPVFLDHIKQKDLVRLNNKLEKLERLLGNLESALFDLTKELNKIKTGTKQNLYPKRETINGNRQVDGLYFMVVIKYLKVLSFCHKLEKIIRKVDKGIHASDMQDILDPTTRDFPSYDKIFRAYNHVHSEAEFLDKYNAAGVELRKGASLENMNARLGQRLEELF